MPCHAAIAARGARPLIPPRNGAKPWSELTPGAAWRNEAIDVIEKSSRREWKVASGYHRRSLAETLIPPQDAHGTQPVGARNRLVSYRSGHPGRRAQPNDHARTPEIRPYRLNSASLRGSCFRSQLMHQRPGDATSKTHELLMAIH